MRKYLTFLLSLILLLSVFSSKATHLSGSYLTYKSLGNNKIEITLKVYRDYCNGIPFFDQPAYISIFDEDSIRIKDIAVSSVQVDTLQFFPADTCVDTSFYNKYSFCIEVGTYVVVDSLPPSNKGYYLVYDRCCLPAYLSNVYDPDFSGSSVVLFIADSLATVANSSPTIDLGKGDLACTWIYNNINKHAIDSDGDSVVYSFVKPFNSTRIVGNSQLPPTKVPTDRIIYEAGYTKNEPFGGLPALLDQDSGIIQAGPELTGAFIYGIKIEEYRNNHYLGYSEFTGMLFTVPYGKDTVDTVNMGSTYFTRRKIAPKIYPNPSINVLNISFEKAVNYLLTIYNEQGVKVLEQSINSELHTVKTENFANGIYFMQLRSNNGQWNGRFVKME